MSDELVKRLRSMHWCVTTLDNGVGVSNSTVAVEAADRIKELKAKLDAARAKEADVVSKTLDAANEHITTQYGISAIGNPIDRSLIIAKIKGEQP